MAKPVRKIHFRLFDRVKGTNERHIGWTVTAADGSFSSEHYVAFKSVSTTIKAG